MHDCDAPLPETATPAAGLLLEAHPSAQLC
jgi:hypothetical protein